MCPSGPIPPKNNSIPPTLAISYSYLQLNINITFYILFIIWLLFVPITLSFEVFGVSIKNVDVLLVNIDVIEEVLVHYENG